MRANKTVPPGLKPLITPQTKLRIALAAMVEHCQSLIDGGRLSPEEKQQTEWLISKVRKTIDGSYGKAQT